MRIAMSELKDVYSKIEELGEKLVTKMDANYKEFTNRMSVNDLKIALLEYRQKPDPKCLETMEAEIAKRKLPKWVTWLLLTLLLGSFAFSVFIIVWHREDIKNINDHINISSTDKEK